MPLGRRRAYLLHLSWSLVFALSLAGVVVAALDLISDVGGLRRGGDECLTRAA
jgi:hypothetical protein